MYLQLISVHGLVRGESVEMGRDADTGGQIRYVLELARKLAEFPQVEAVDLFTRRIKDRRVDDDYARHIEQLGPKCRLVRLPCGGGRYLRKERLWPHLDEFIDAMIAFTRRTGKTPAVVHGHYADAGYVAKEVSAALNVPFVFTGHSLGKPKLEYLLNEGWTHQEANSELAIDHRINVEQDCLMMADLIVTSTKHERDAQWGMYSGSGDAKFEVIPPGTDLQRYFPYYDYDLSHQEIDERFKQARVRMTHDLRRFHFAPDKPLILALCRPDRRKNIGALIDAYGRSNELQAIANLAILAGIRDDIETMPDNEQQVLTDMLLAMDRYNLYGKMAIPKNHDSEFDVPELYRLAASSRGVFVNTAFTELFGLTAIEASAVGLPFVVTENGGPQDIAENCDSGLLVDVNDSAALTDAMVRMLTDGKLWDRCSANGINRVREHYAWQSHAEHYLQRIEELARTPRPAFASAGLPVVGPRLASVDALLVTDIDNTLVGDDDAMAALLELVRANRDRLALGIASGRAPRLVREVLDRYGIHDIDVVISAVGSEIYYGRDFEPDRGWASRLRVKWRPERVREALAELPFLTLQDRDDAQREFKVSYDLDHDVDPEQALADIHQALAATRTAYSLILSHGVFVDVLPQRASKGKAVRYLADKWNIPIERIATAGDSGNDRDMLQGRTAGIVVGNHDQELASLRDSRASRVYFAQGHYAAGIIEGLRHYRLIPESEPAAAATA